MELRRKSLRLLFSALRRLLATFREPQRSGLAARMAERLVPVRVIATPAGELKMRCTGPIAIWRAPSGRGGTPSAMHP